MYGNSGGAVALQYAVRFPDALLGLIVAATSPSGRLVSENARQPMSPYHPRWRGEVAAAAGLLRNAASARGHDALHWVRPRAGLWILARGAVPGCVVEAGELSEQERLRFEAGAAFDVTRDLHAVAVPALLLYGRHDEYAPLEHGELLRDLLPRAELVVLERSGHVLAGDERDAFEAAVRAFVGSLPVRLGIARD